MAARGKRAYASAFPDIVYNGSPLRPVTFPCGVAKSPSWSHPMSAPAHLQDPSSPTAVGFIPGQWDDRPNEIQSGSEDATDAVRTATVYTTFARFARPLFSAIYDCIVGPIIRRYTHRQVIRAEPVINEDGARKKIYLDQGLEDRNAPHKFEDTPNTNRLPLPLGASSSRSPATAASSNVTAVRHRAASSPNANRNKGTPTKNRGASTKNNTSLARGWDSFAGKSSLKITSKNATQQVSPVALVRNPRIAHLTGAFPNHTSLTQIVPRRSVLGTIQPNSKAYAQRIAETRNKVIAERHAANLKRAKEMLAAGRAKRDAERVKATQASFHDVFFPTPDLQEPTFLSRSSEAFQKEARNTEPVDPQIPIAEAVKPARIDGIPESGPYDNDLSTLSDAPPLPPKKTVVLNSQARVKRFKPETVAGDLADSSIINVVFSPEKLQKQDSVDESALSLEAVEDHLKKVTLITDEEEDAHITEPSPSPEPLLPLIPELHQEDLVHILEASKKTKGGRVEKDIVEGKINTRDMKTLLPNEFNGDPSAWLNDNIVNEYLALLINHEKKKAGFTHKSGGPPPPLHAFVSQWYVNAAKSMKTVGRWAKIKQFGGKNFLKLKLLLIPICDGSHWRLLALKPQDRTIEYLDSLHLNSQKYINKAREYLKQELGDDYKEEEWTVVEKGRSLRQLNGSDCGVFTCLNALALIRGEDPDRVEVDNGMRLARRHIAVSLLTGNVDSVLE